MSEQTISSWFSTQEYKSRLAKIQNELKKRDLEGLVTLQPETITWTTGYYSKGYTGFQLAIIPAEGDPFIMCRNVSAYYVEKTYAFSEYEYWVDGDKKIKKALGLISRALGNNARIGIEVDAWPLVSVCIKNL